MFEFSQLQGGPKILIVAKKCNKCQKLPEQIKDFFFLAIWKHGNHDNLFLYKKYECQEIQIKNPFDSILSFGLVKDFWKWILFH
jgi:hypothetical protein